jgi:hypothetical protein
MVRLPSNTLLDRRHLGAADSCQDRTPALQQSSFEGFIGEDPKDPMTIDKDLQSDEDLKPSVRLFTWW